MTPRPTSPSPTSTHSMPTRSSRRLALKVSAPVSKPSESTGLKFDIRSPASGRSSSIRRASSSSFFSVFLPCYDGAEVCSRPFPACLPESQAAPLGQPNPWWILNRWILTVFEPLMTLKGQVRAQRARPAEGNHGSAPGQNKETQRQSPRRASPCCRGTVRAGHVLLTPRLNHGEMPSSVSNDEKVAADQVRSHAQLSAKAPQGTSRQPRQNPIWAGVAFPAVRIVPMTSNR